MPDVDHLARQWLETDAAFGISEVPIARGRKGSVSPAAPVKTAPVARPTAVVVPPSRSGATETASRLVPSAPLPQNVAAAAKPRDARSAVVPAGKSVINIPAAPAGSIADLPAITRAQKEAAFEALRKQIEQFARPFINDVSTRVVFGEGDCDASLMFIGEGPGAEEDRTGRPFVGRSGQLLDKMIAAIGQSREKVFIGNVVKLRAADWTEDGSRVQDRPPNPEEVARWIPFLHKQIEIIRPRVIVTLGAPALKYVTGSTEGVTKIRGTWLSYRGIPVMPTYHPAFVLRAYTEENRRKVWNDLKAAAAKAGGAG